MGGLARGSTGGAREADGDGRTKWGEYRAAFLKAGVDPRAWETMSMYELESMMRSLKPKTNEPTDAEWEAGQDMLADAVANLPDVRL
jgi:hypothetical protein